MKKLYIIVILMASVLTAGAQDYKNALNFGVGAMYGNGIQSFLKYLIVDLKIIE